MSKAKRESETSSSQVDKVGGEDAVRSAQDRPDDPLFVPHLEDLEIAAGQSEAER